MSSRKEKDVIKIVEKILDDPCGFDVYCNCGAKLTAPWKVRVIENNPYRAPCAMSVIEENEERKRAKRPILQIEPCKRCLIERYHTLLAKKLRS